MDHSEDPLIACSRVSILLNIGECKHKISQMAGFIWVISERIANGIDLGILISIDALAF
jgi:hypothetical protein